jgi:hypothetical protein
MKIYFAHHMNEYGTALEERAIVAIKEHFASIGGELINPGSPEIGAAAKTLYPLVGMEMFDVIARNCDIVVAMPFIDGKFGAGVYSELLAARRAKRPLYRVDLETLQISPMDFLEIEGLSISETRKRIGRT